MTHRRTLEHHRHSLSEIRDIMNSMKTLAYMETRKLSRFLDAQHAVVRNIELAAEDLLGFHPGILPEAEHAVPAYLLIGTERGFCGDFNHALVEHLKRIMQERPGTTPLIIAIGRKLHSLLEGDTLVVSRLDGAGIVEEVPVQLNRIVDELTMLQDRYGMLAISCIYKDVTEGIIQQQLSPPFRHLAHRRPAATNPPLLNLAPSTLLADLTDHYLFTALHKMLYASLMSENRHRVTHLEHAVTHLERRVEEIARQCNALRQEEIIEEIEVILLNATAGHEGPGGLA